jgi:hypothetical protein
MANRRKIDFHYQFSFNQPSMGQMKHIFLRFFTEACSEENIAILYPELPEELKEILTLEEIYQEVQKKKNASKPKEQL